MSSVRLIELNKFFDNGVHAVCDVNLHIDDGEFVVLVGPSGCGKSTTLRMIAGLEDITSGDICIGDQLVNGVEPSRRDIAMVFQNYALYPHMSVRQNMAFGLKMRGMPKTEIAKRVEVAAQALSIDQFLDRRPRDLSGGERQRVALGRAITRNPKVFLLDEPLSNLDAKLRVQMRSEIANLQNRLGTTMIYVTHDQVEAMTLGDRVVLMHEGVIQQVASPVDMYRRPANRFVGTFIGSPAMNMFPGVVHDGVFCLTPSNENGCGDAISSHSIQVGKEIVSGPATLGIRPEDLTTEDTLTPLAAVVVEVVEHLGHETLIHFQLGGESHIARMEADSSFKAGDRVKLSIRPNSYHLFSEGETGQRLN